MTGEQMIAAPGGATIHVTTLGAGAPVLLIPSLARGVADFDSLAESLAAAGFLAILPEPRGIGRSTGPDPGDLFDLARDVAAVITALEAGPAHLIGHAFGNRVARATAALAPDLVASVALLAGGGEVPPSPDISAALRGAVSQGLKPDEERLADIQLAFFAKGQDAKVWLHGWNAAAAQAQSAAVRATPTARWWTAGQAPVLLVQALEDPIALIGNAEALGRDIGDRLTLVSLAHASHAILPEQPEAVAAALILWLKGERDASILQAAIDAEVRAPA
jgi:pimeloyl-ACP methyl ester carboxylesterase